MCSAAESLWELPERCVLRGPSAGRGGAERSSRQGALALCVCAARTNLSSSGSRVPLVPKARQTRVARAHARRPSTRRAPSYPGPGLSASER